ncbi:MAG: FAD:protein FMN transferase [Candidatus Pacebacteria bacterium]|nr:FAD:protein FMN transferase [Candidatus Paceibacterota bacterium]
MRQTRTIMGMPVQLEIVDANATQADYDTVFDYLTAVDQRFSTYKADSEISRINRGEIEEKDFSDEMLEVLALSQETAEITDGYFSIYTPDHAIDPSGLVKGWAINNAAALLWERGFRNFYVEVAGDIQTAGLDSEGKEWSIGVRNPLKRDEIVKVLYPHGKGIATSGTYERGSHIYNPHEPEEKEHDYVSLTVLGPNVYEADRFATAAFAMGTPGMYFIESLPEFEAYAIDAKGNAVMTSGFETYTTL